MIENIPPLFGLIVDETKRTYRDVIPAGVVEATLDFAEDNSAVVLTSIRFVTSTPPTRDD